MAINRMLLETNFSADYPGKPGVLKRIELRLGAGEVMGLVGESGSGKSTLALALLKLLRWKGGRVQGQIMFRGRDLLTLSEKEMRRIRGFEIGLVMQSPLASLNPVLSIGTQVAEAWKAHRQRDAEATNGAVRRALVQVGLPDDNEFMRRYPSQISVGQAQRVVIAIAVMHRPALLVADEPTSALDVVTQRDLYRMLATLNKQTGTGILFISHDLQSVATICRKIAILHEGEIVECGSAERILQYPQHPYTEELLACAPWVQLPKKPQTAKVYPAVSSVPKRDEWIHEQKSFTARMGKLSESQLNLFRLTASWRPSRKIR